MLFVNLALSAMEVNKVGLLYMVDKSDKGERRREYDVIDGPAADLSRPPFGRLYTSIGCFYAFRLEVHQKCAGLVSAALLFQRIRATHECLHMVPTLWPGDMVVESFVSRSSGHFVYASTVIKFVDDRDWNPEERIKIILGIERAPLWSASPFSALDQLYTGILADVPNQQCLQHILSAIATRLRLPLYHIGELLELRTTDIQVTLRRLPSLIDVIPSFDGHGFKPASLITAQHASFLDFLNDPARSAQFHVDDDARHSIALQILKVFSLPPGNRFLPRWGHIWRWGRRHVEEPWKWLRDQDGPADLIQDWNDYMWMGMFELALKMTPTHPGEDVHDLSEALETAVSPKLVRIIQTSMLIRAGSGTFEGLYSLLRTIRFILDYSWEEMRTAIAEIQPAITTGSDALNLCQKISSASYIQELHPNPTLQALAKSCVELVCLHLKMDDFEMSIICGWSHILRACFPTTELLETVERLVTTENLAVLKQSHGRHDDERSSPIHNIIVWLEVNPMHPSAPLHLIGRVKAFEDTAENRDKYEADWKQWKQCTGF
ncbi:hypothetical protein R3P38DRAFT_3449501 [Favolaschia claudopus]|uniref:Uncharacterized protein n=1 Tax=Favolaschia claudopus TaxID=2862362 RepID=A0AAW0CVB4_9AGAR